ncbi:uncharacterized protein LOC118485100 [Helianthus annuus]|uniref:uncharacterized protein LOC118485100 n=1 Tax=Helianthus annuus TaxID=4232 RepID=UPI001653389A|nr:uncharacterized protein LOC118485100 [Helianthus annuus]
MFSFSYQPTHKPGRLKTQPKLHIHKFTPVIPCYIFVTRSINEPKVTKVVFVFLKKYFCTSFVFPKQTTRIHRGLQLVCFLEELSIKNICPISLSRRACPQSSNLFKTSPSQNTHLSNHNQSPPPLQLLTSSPPPPLLHHSSCRRLHLPSHLLLHRRQHISPPIATSSAPATKEQKIILKVVVILFYMHIWTNNANLDG